jgi:hypothetical protein
MAVADPLRTYPCPHCGEILLTGTTPCPACGTPIDAAVAEAVADRHEQFQKAFGEANSLVITARAFLAFFALSFVPFLSPLGQLGVLLLLVWVPVLLLRWYRRYGKLDYPGDEYRQARDWVQQAVVIWGLALFATPIRYFIEYGVR